MEGHVLLKKLRDALELMKGCMTGINKEEVEQAISLVSLLYFLLIPVFIYALFWAKGLTSRNILIFFDKGMVYRDILRMIMVM